ncbi:hypothetical protein C8J56DRAFT_355436 [Mycena floridula]|nr:hypothetical protein C8J56DRAFT_355436 [Mycena floridula]
MGEQGEQETQDVEMDLGGESISQAPPSRPARAEKVKATVSAPGAFEGEERKCYNCGTRTSTSYPRIADGRRACNKSVFLARIRDMKLITSGAGYIAIDKGLIVPMFRPGRSEPRLESTLKQSMRSSSTLKERIRAKKCHLQNGRPIVSSLSRWSHRRIWTSMIRPRSRQALC